MKGSILSLLTRLMSQRNLDVQVTLTALLDLPVSAGLSLIKKNAASFGAQFIRILSLTNVALVVCATHKQTEYGHKCLALKQDSIWGYVLSKYGVSNPSCASHVQRDGKDAGDDLALIEARSSLVSGSS